MAAFDEVAEVEQNGNCPRAYGNIGEDRVQRMTQPGAVSQGLEVAPWFAEQFVGATDNLLKEIGDRLEPALPVDETVDDVIEHRRLLSEYPPAKIVRAQGSRSSQPEIRLPARAASSMPTGRKRTVSPGRAWANSGRSALMTVAITG